MISMEVRGERGNFHGSEFKKGNNVVDPMLPPPLLEFMCYCSPVKKVGTRNAGAFSKQFSTLWNVEQKRKAQGTYRT